MKFALSNSSPAPDDLPAFARRCRSMGYDGVELDYTAHSGAEIRRIFDDAGVQIACINSTRRFIQNAPSDAKAAQEIIACLDAAQQMGCHLVKVAEPRPPGRQSISVTINAMADWLEPLVNAAADRGVSIVIENGQTFFSARSLWSLMERLDHRAVGVCWDVEKMLAAGEAAAITVPTLNSRIRYVRMGDGNVHEAMTRLRGIGYQGWVAYANEIGAPEKFLVDVRRESGTLPRAQPA